MNDSVLHHLKQNMIRQLRDMILVVFSSRKQLSNLMNFRRTFIPSVDTQLYLCKATNRLYTSENLNANSISIFKTIYSIWKNVKAACFTHYFCLLARWVQGHTARKGCLFNLSDLPMTPFLVENWSRSCFCKMLNFWWNFP